MSVLWACFRVALLVAHFLRLFTLAAHFAWLILWYTAQSSVVLLGP